MPEELVAEFNGALSPQKGVEGMLDDERGDPSAELLQAFLWHQFVDHPPCPSAYVSPVDIY